MIQSFVACPASTRYSRKCTRCYKMRCIGVGSTTCDVSRANNRVKHCWLFHKSSFPALWPWIQEDTTHFIWSAPILQFCTAPPGRMVTMHCWQRLFKTAARCTNNACPKSKWLDQGLRVQSRIRQRLAKSVLVLQTNSSHTEFPKLSFRSLNDVYTEIKFNIHRVHHQAANFRHLVHQAEPLWTEGLKERSPLFGVFEFALGKMFVS